MAQPQKNSMVLDNKQNQDSKDSPEWVVIADDWIDLDDKMDDDEEFEDMARSNTNELHDHVTSDQAKSKTEPHDHFTSLAVTEIKKTEPNEDTSGPKVLTRYVDVPEDLVKFFAGKDVVMDLQIASSAMIQLTKAYDVDAKYRPVRLIGNLENVEKAEKLIKAVVALADAGGTVLLRKNDSDTYDYGTKYGNYKKQEAYQSHYFSQKPESWGPFQFDRKFSHKRSHGRC
ncbi:hypothetical protein POM88_048640 [Heracleum sosnowskyi]|uniref:Uncharacterized protein n=1 Tax=Heracleum sosnowskyi TaxID=360622 RepID=A0AAD8M0N7_9APIA|nr:hypothetical protein POM88_048640 [Heracleum sosnowskyi]